MMIMMIKSIEKNDENDDDDGSNRMSVRTKKNMTCQRGRGQYQYWTSRSHSLHCLPISAHRPYSSSSSSSFFFLLSSFTVFMLYPVTRNRAGRAIHRAVERPAGAFVAAVGAVGFAVTDLRAKATAVSSQRASGWHLPSTTK